MKIISGWVCPRLVMVASSSRLRVLLSGRDRGQPLVDGTGCMWWAWGNSAGLVVPLGVEDDDFRRLRASANYALNPRWPQEMHACQEGATFIVSR